MPLVPSCSDEALLRILLVPQAADFDVFLDVAETASLVKALQQSSGHELYPAHSENPMKARGMWRDLESLESQGFLEFDRRNPHVRLTPLGVFRAMLFDPPTQFQQPLAAAFAE